METKINNKEVIVAKKKTELISKIVSKITSKMLFFIICILGVCCIIFSVGLATGGVDLTTADMKALVNVINQDRKEQHEFNNRLAEKFANLQKQGTINTVLIGELKEDIKEIKKDVREIKIMNGHKED